MVTYETLRTLIACPDKEALIEAVNKLAEEDAKLALVMAMLSWKNIDNSYKETSENALPNQKTNKSNNTKAVAF